MPDGMGLGMSGQTPWGRSLAGMQNSMTFPGMGFQWPSMRSATPPRMPPNPATQAQPGPVKADMSGMQQAFGNLQAQQAGKMAADEEKARREADLQTLLGGFPGLRGSLPGLDGVNQGLWAGMKTAFVLENSDGEKTAAETSDQATGVRGDLSAAPPSQGASPCHMKNWPLMKTAQVVIDYLEKTAAPAWVRQIQQGALSPQSIQRVASSLPAGKFRFLENLGRGQFNVADKVVGNVGGHAGTMVRKLPAHAYTNPGLAYDGLKPFVDRVNRLIPTQTGKPLIAPYLETGSQGAFQRLGTEDIGRMPMAAKHYLSDLHSGNIGPGGQIIDFAAKDQGLGWAPKAARRVSRLGTDPARTQIPGGVDAATTIAQDNPLNQRINNAIRHFYHAPADVRQNFPGVTNIAPPTTATSIPSNLPETVPYKPSPATLGSSPIQRIGLGLLGTAGGLATALNKHGDDGMDAIARYLQKRAAQDNSAPQRSATGESEGLSYQHKEDDYAQGQAAWAATSKYFKGGGKLRSQPNPFRGKHRGKAKRAMDTLSGVNTQGTVAKPGKPAKPAKALRTRPPRVKRANLAAVSGVKDSAKTSDPILLRQAIIAELDASNLYDQMGDSTGNNRLRSLFSDVSREEKVHVGEFTRLLNAADPENPGALAEGQAEVKQAGVAEIAKLAINAHGMANPARAVATTARLGKADVNRRDFLKLLGLEAGGLAADPSVRRVASFGRRYAPTVIANGAVAATNPATLPLLAQSSFYDRIPAKVKLGLLGGGIGGGAGVGYELLHKQSGDNAFWCAKCKCPRRECGCAHTEKKAYTGPTQLSLQGQMPNPTGHVLLDRLLAARRQRRKGMDADVTMLDKNAAASAPMMPARLISRLVPLNSRRGDTEMQPQEMQAIDHGQGQLFPEPFQTDATPIPELMASPSKQGLLAGVAGGLAGGGLGYGAGKLAERLGGTGEHSGLIGGLLGGVGGAALAGLSRFKGQRKRNEHLEEIMRRLPPGATKHDYVNSEMLWEALMNRFGGEKISRDVGPFAQAFLRRCVEQGLTLEQIKTGIDQVEARFGKEASDELTAGLEKLAAPIPWGQLAGKAVNWGSKALGMGGQAINKVRGAVQPATSAINRAVGGQGARMAGGAMTGYTAAHDPSNTESSMLNPMSWGGREWAGALGGAAFGRAMPHMGATAQAAGQRAFGGMMAGNTLGYAADAAGFEGVGDQLGRAGAIGGFASPFIKGLKPGQMAPKVQQAGNTFNQVFQKPWEKATGLNPKSVWRGLTDKAAPMAERVGMGIGPGMVTAGLGGTAAMVGIDGLKQHFGDAMVSRVEQEAPRIFQQMTGMNPEQARALASSAQGLSQLLNIGDPIFKMLGMDPTQMSGIQKIMLLLGGGAVLGGMFGGSGGVTGMGSLALLGGLAMGGFPGLGGGQAPAASAAPAGNAGMTPDAATGTMRPTPYLNTTQPQPRNELAVQRNANRGNPQAAESNAVNQAMLS